MSALLWKPMTEEHIANPYGMYAALRREDPVHRAQTGEFIVTKYDDIRSILKSDSFESGNRLLWLKKGIRYFENKQEDFRAIYQAMNSFVLMLNGEHHQRIRNFVSRAWDNRKVDPIIAKSISAVLGRIAKPDLDFVADYAQPIPVLTISEILGVPATDYQVLVDLGVAMTKTLDLYVSYRDLVTMNDAATRFIDFFREQVRIKLEKPDNGLFSALIRKNRDDRTGLSEEELISIGIFLFTAGEETSAGLISNMMLHLLRHPAQLQALRASPELIAPATEEVLRFDSVVQLLGRVAREDMALRDKVIPAGATVTLVVGSGNRDEDAFPRPDELDLRRHPNRHLSFGSGVHYCLGDWLGRRQSQLAINAFLERYPRISLPDQTLTWYPNLAVRRLNSLRVYPG